jgi:glutamine synthetase
MPLHWNIRESSQGEYYCGINRGSSIEREIMEEFTKRSIESGIRVSGFNQEVAHAQWEYQIGPDGDWNGSGCHINISTNGTRNDIEMKEIKRIIHTIGTDHEKWMGVYDGNNNHLRLSGEHETSDPSLFTWGIGTRHTSIRIPNQVAQEGKGYFEDRRPGSSIDYYLTLSKYCEYI